MRIGRSGRAATAQADLVRFSKVEDNFHHEAAESPQKDYDADFHPLVRTPTFARRIAAKQLLTQLAR
jgi:hypothetical protein